MIIAAIISFFAILAWDLISDYKKWLSNFRVNHGKEAVLRSALLVVPTVLFCLAHPDKFYWILIGNVLLMQFFTFWLLFDGIYNKLRGFDWWFAGSNDPDDPVLDNIVQASPKLIAGLKIAGMIIFITTYIITWN